MDKLPRVQFPGAASAFLFKLSRKALGLFVAFCLLFSASLVSAGVSFSLFDSLRITSNPTPVPLEGVTLGSSAEIAGQGITLSVSFVTPDIDFPYDYRVGVTFPPEFGFDESVTASFTDDVSPPDPDLRLIEIIDHTVIFRFRRTFFAPEAGQVGLITVNGVTLPQSSGEYAASVFITDIDYVVLAGPTFTNTVSVVPDVPVSLEISPGADMILTAGQAQYFTAQAQDQYGNSIADSSLSWSFLNGISLGELTPGVLFPTTVGISHIVVSSESVADTSGLLRVIAGEADRLKIVLFQPVFVGGELCDSGYVIALDDYGNELIDLGLSLEPLTLSVSEGSVTPNVFTSSPISGSVDLRDVGLRFEGFIGLVNISATQGALVSSPLSVLVEGVTVEPVGDASAGLWTPVLPLDKNITGTLQLSRTNVPALVDSVSFVGDDSRVVVRGTFESGGEVKFRRGEPLFFTGSPRNEALAVTTYGEFVRGVGFGPTCPTTYTRTVPITLLDDNIGHTSIVDTIILGQAYENYAGFGVVNPFGVVELSSLRLEVDAGSEWAFLGQGIRARSFRVIQSRELIYDLRPLSPLTFTPGLAAVRLIATVSDGSFRFPDTAIAEGQICLTPRADFEAIGESFAPAYVLPDNSPQFSMGFERDGLSVGEIEFRTIRFELFNESEKIIVPAQLASGDVFNVRSDPVYISPDMAETQWQARFVLDYRQLGLNLTDTLPVPAPAVTIGPLSQLVLDSVTINSPNAPLVSGGQEFSLVAHIHNQSLLTVAGAFLSVAVEGEEGKDTVAIADPLPGGASISVPVSVNAGDISGERIFTLSVSLESSALAQDEISASVTVQEPALLEFSGSVIESEDGAVLIGRPLNLSLLLENLGEAEVSGGEVRVTVNGAGLQRSFLGHPAVGLMEATLGTPSEAGPLIVTARIASLPYELNTLQSADIASTDSLTFTLRAVESLARARVSIATAQPRGTVFGEFMEFFSVEIINESDGEADLRLLSFAALFRGSGGTPLEPSRALVVDQSSLRDDEGIVRGSVTERDGKLQFILASNSIPSGGSLRLTFKSQLAHDADIGAFSLEIPVSEFRLRVTSGLQSGLIISAETNSGAPAVSSGEYILTSASFVSSFRTRNNPFNPDLGANSYSYTLTTDADLEIAIYTLIGEAIWRQSFSSGSPAGSAGTHVINWDGRNDDGEVVRDGVYVLIFTNQTTGEKAVLKQAVLR